MKKDIVELSLNHSVKKHTTCENIQDNDVLGSHVTQQQLRKEKLFNI